MQIHSEVFMRSC